MTGAPLQEALALHQAGRLDEAEQHYRRLLTIESEDADCLHLLGMILFQRGEPDAAVELIRGAIALHPSGAAYYANLGNILQSVQNDAEAEACYRTSLSIRANQATVWTNLGHLLKKRAQVDSALRCYEQALSIDPQLKEAEAGKATSLLLKGEYGRGWELFEARWQTRDWAACSRVDTFPRWSGDDVGSGHLLIWGEQGIGDEIMFAGLVPELLAAGTPCALACEERLRPLFARSFPEAAIVSADDSRQLATLNIVAQLPSGSLPGLLRRTAADFSQSTSPYLIADAAMRNEFRNKYEDGRPLVGVAWHTKNRTSGYARSIGLAALTPLFADQNIRWIGLQYGEKEALQKEIAESGAPVLLDEDVDQLQDMDRFAAQVAAMDLVVTIDNSTAHLAAALGVPTWILLPHAPDWRWLLERNDSPWYPSMRVFRAPGAAAWGPVVERVKSALLAELPLR